ncbi:hypothetical protein GCM10009733_006110 [Nonomuraea maheshkhaliensis]|uniref:Toxin n=1 Tax=Nonomuraea maheshkhaliensis TaxID=419590 RepID=A0ABP4QPS8_9ACTN
MVIARTVLIDEVVELLPHRFSPRTDIPDVCDRLSGLRGREVVPVPFDSRDHPHITCSVTGFCIRTQARDFLGYPADASDAYKTIVFLHEVGHWATNDAGQPFSHAALIRSAAPTLCRLRDGETIQDVLGRDDYDDPQERAAERFALDVVGTITSGVHRADPWSPSVLRGVHGPIADPFGSRSRETRCPTG